MVQTCLFDDDYLDELYGYNKIIKKESTGNKNIVDDSFLMALRKALDNKEISYFKYLSLRRDYINDRKIL